MVETRLLAFPWGQDTAWLRVGVTADAAVTGVFFAPPGEAAPADGPFAPVAEELAGYFAGTRQRFEVALATTGTPFQNQVWAALREIPFGRTTTYGAIATALGLTHGARAVGLANGKNPVGIIVPCHRVIGRDGTLTGYAGGLDNKRKLLVHEGAILA